VNAPADPPPRTGAVQILAAASKLGVTSFGGPIAHLGYFRDEYVQRRRWLPDERYADLVALSQLLPGPASSQVGIGVGWIRGGYLGGLLAWLGFTLPSAVLLVVFAWAVRGADTTTWLRGLEIAAVSVVAYAVWSMARALTPDRSRIAIALAAAVLVLAWRSPGAQVVAIAAGGLLGWRFLHADAPGDGGARAFPESRRAAVAALAVFALLLGLLPLLAAFTESGTVDVVASFYRTGSLVFGGGHVVLPLLQAEVVEPGWVSSQDFVAGYGAAQAVPGPLFTFAAYLGYVMDVGPGGVAGAAIATAAIFLPSFLLVYGTLPFWASLRRRPSLGSALLGLNAAVVGLLLAALYDPVWTSAILGPADFALALGGLALLAVARVPPWLAVAVIGVAGAAIAYWS
jgi:chromate transporter